jgi:flagellar biosynthesis/type III secretory pathway M-ring protein FliF/YscJ
MSQRPQDPPQTEQPLYFERTGSNPGLPTVPPPVPTPAPASSGTFIPLPQWLVQLVPILVVIIAAALAFASQRSDVESLKAVVQDLKNDRISRELFNARMQEQERNNSRIEGKVDNIEKLVRNMYERNQPKERSDGR